MFGAVLRWLILVVCVMGGLLYVVLLAAWLLLSGLFVVCLLDCCFKDGCLCLGFGLCYLDLMCFRRCIGLLVALVVLALGCVLMPWRAILAICLSLAIDFGFLVVI